MPSFSFEGLLPRFHPTAWVHPSAQVLGDVELGEDVSIWPTAVLRGDSGRIQIGARTNIQDGSVAHATTGVSTTTIGEDCTVGHRVILHGCSVGNRCLIGMGSIVLDNVELGDDCFVAAGSLITPGKKYPAGSFIMGSPAKVVRPMTEKDKHNIVESWRIYVKLMRSYRDAR